MALTKDDLKNIKSIVQVETRKIVQVETKKIVQEETRKIVQEETGKIVDNKINELAIMIQKEFKANAEEHRQFTKNIEQLMEGQKQIRLDISGLQFIATEMVRREELNDVKQRLSVLEARLKPVK